MRINNNIKTNIFYITVVVLIVLFVCYARVSLRYLEFDHKISISFIDEIKTVGREQAILIKYHFNVGRKVYYSETSFSRAQMSYENFKLLEQKSFPVAYNLKNHGISSCILIFPKNFAAFHVPFPDSLNWIISLSNK